jgi:hypothetical protein
MADIELRANLDLLNDRLDTLFRQIDKSAKYEYVTPRIIRVPVGLRADQAYTVVGGPAQGRQWHIRRVHLEGEYELPVYLYSDESISPVSQLWEFTEAPLQETWGREEMVIFHPDVLVVATNESTPGDVLGGQVQVVDMPQYGVWNEPSEA